MGGLRLSMFNELDRVALVDDLPEYGLQAGDIGMIVHIYSNHKGYELEFVTLHGDFVALVSVFPTQIRTIADNEIASARPVQQAS